MIRNAAKFRTVCGLALILAVMTGLTSYSVTLYELFCDITGYGGTTQRADAPADRILDRKITVQFNADVNAQLDWDFEPAQRQVELRVGEKGLAFYRARSTATVPVNGTATFNVTPNKAGLYFVKVECFCFTEQTLEPGQAVDMPVQFYIDPEIANDRNLDEVETITLSYTFFRTAAQKSAGGAQAAISGGENSASTRRTVN